MTAVSVRDPPAELHERLARRRAPGQDGIDETGDGAHHVVDTPTPASGWASRPQTLAAVIERPN